MGSEVPGGSLVAPVRRPTVAGAVNATVTNLTSVKQPRRDPEIRRFQAHFRLIPPCKRLPAWLAADRSERASSPATGLNLGGKARESTTARRCNAGRASPPRWPRWSLREPGGSTATGRRGRVTAVTSASGPRLVGPARPPRPATCGANTWRLDLVDDQAAHRGLVARSGSEGRRWNRGR